MVTWMYLWEGQACNLDYDKKQGNPNAYKTMYRGFQSSVACEVKNEEIGQSEEKLQA